MVCPKCQSENVVVNYSEYTKSKSRSFLWNLIMCICTAGLWLIWMLVRKKKEKVIRVKKAVCQNCGHSWNV